MAFAAGLVWSTSCRVMTMALSMSAVEGKSDMVGPHREVCRSRYNSDERGLGRVAPKDILSCRPPLLGGLSCQKRAF